MKAYLFKMSLALVVFVCAAIAFAQGVPVVPAPASAPSLSSVILANGGFMGFLVSLIVAFNVFMSSLQQVFNTLKVAEPGPMQKLGAYGAKVASWVSANVEHPDVPVQKSG